MSFLTTPTIILLGLFSISTIVVVHEFGHYIFARLFSVTVHEFSIGIGPLIFKRQGAHTLFALRLLPLGGYCKLESVDVSKLSHLSKKEMSEPVPFRVNSLYSISYLKRIIILLGGAFANILLFALLFFTLYLFSYKEDFISSHIEPIEGQPAYEIGLEIGDTITHVNSEPVVSFTDLTTILPRFTSEKITLQILRDGKEYTYMPTLNSEQPLLGIRPFIPPLVQSVVSGKKAALFGFQAGDRIVAIQGIKIANAIDYFSLLQNSTQSSIEFQIESALTQETITHTIEFNSNPIQEMGLRFPQELKKKWSSFPQFTQHITSLLSNTFTSTFRILFQVLTFNTKDLRENTSGPIRIISIIGNSTLDNLTTSGIASAIFHFIRITGIISLAIGIFNLLPIPVLDGGHILFHSIYKLRRKTPSYKSVARYNNIGIIFLLALFVLVVFNDVRSILQW